MFKNNAFGDYDDGEEMLNSIESVCCRKPNRNTI